MVREKSDERDGRIKKIDMIIKTKDGVYTPEKLTTLPPNNIFVFGSSLVGKRRAGAALDAAMYFGAEKGVGEGMTGQSYALPTIDWQHRVMFGKQIRNRFITFFKYAWSHPELTFWMTKVGCGIAGYETYEIKRIMGEAMRITPFCGGPLPVDNVHFPKEFTDQF